MATRRGAMFPVMRMRGTKRIGMPMSVRIPRDGSHGFRNQLTGGMLGKILDLS